MKSIQQEVIDGNINPYDLLDLWKEKTLDKEDIESLGWEYRSPDWTYPHLLWFTKLNYKSKRSNETDGNILFNPKDGWILVSEEYDSSDENKTIFAGTIKNKSELKVLMKQLGITND